MLLIVSLCFVMSRSIEMDRYCEEAEASDQGKELDKVSQ
jgi:hypothetical protein